MKKYLLIPIFFIAALATANADCGGCGGGEHAEKKESCCKSECDKEKCGKEKCDKEKCDKAKSKGKSCCAKEKAEKE